MDLATEDDMNAFLAHHGVKGMKWGVRKDAFGVGGIDLHTGQQTGTAVNRGPVRSNEREHVKDTYKVLDSVTKHLNSSSAVKSYNAKMAQKVATISKPTRAKYQAKGAESLSEVISEHLARKKVTGVHVKTFSIGPDQYQYILGDKKTVDAALGDLGTKKMAHADISQGAVKFTVTFLWNADGTPNGYQVGGSELVHDDLVSDFLAHHGVKGQKWGVRKAVETGAGGAKKAAASTVSKVSATAKNHSKAVTATRVALSNPQLRDEATKAAKVAFTVTKYGVVPLAAATGIALPAVAGLGLSMKFISDPGVHAAVASAASYSRGVLKSIGPIHMSAIPKMPKVSMPHLKQPFSTKTSKMVEAGAKNPTLRGKPGSYEMKTKSGWVGISNDIAKSALK